jgi:excisionase family DNA binding protein
MELLTITEVASRIGVSRRTVERHIRMNAFGIQRAVTRTPGIGVRVNVDAAEKYMAAARPGRVRKPVQPPRPVIRYSVGVAGDGSIKHLMRSDDPRIAECGARGPFVAMTAETWRTCRHCRARALEKGVAYDQ